MGRVGDNAIEPFEISIAEPELDDLFRRVRATRWPDELPGHGWDYGVPSGYLRRVADYWADGYSWRANEARLNAVPQFVTTIDGARMHFYHARSEHPDAVPLLLLHGWPGSAVEFIHTLAPLADPSIDAGDPSDAFHVVCVSLPGYGFSGPTTDAGWDTVRIARAVDALMTRLGYAGYVAHGTDWGSMILRSFRDLDDHHLRAAHVSNLYTSAMADAALGGPVSADEERVIARRNVFHGEQSAYMALQTTTPQTLAYGLTDSPVGLLAWIIERFKHWADTSDLPEDAVALDDILTVVMVFWLTNTVASSFRLYHEDGRTRDWTRADRSELPVAVAAFPHEPAGTLRRYAEATHNIVRWTTFDRGGHFPGLEEPDLLVADIRASLRPFRS